MGDDLFTASADEALARRAPLAVRMRPRTLDEFVGQGHAVGDGTPLRREIEHDVLSSLILYGPPGSGKTSLARVVAGTTEAYFAELSAVSSGVKDVRAAIEAARARLGMDQRRSILFIDEIHRFNRSQQDALLHAVEDGVVILVGATTENPFFEVNAPLISRSRIVELTPLSDEDLAEIARRALADERGFGAGVGIDDEALDALVIRAGGDARVALTMLETAAVHADGEAIHLGAVEEASRTRVLPYDRQGDVHYDVVSAFIKSMRGGDPDAAVYWLARMVHGGEDPKFIARRMLIFAAEDVGNADPTAVLVAQAAVKAAEFIGWPECRINLAQAAIYLSMAPRSNSVISAIDGAIREVESGPARQVPAHLRDSSYRGAKELGRGTGYAYPHPHPGGHVEQQYLPDGLEGRRFYEPSARGWEARRVRDIPGERADDGLEGEADDGA